MQIMVTTTETTDFITQKSQLFMFDTLNNFKNAINKIYKKNTHMIEILQKCLYITINTINNKYYTTINITNNKYSNTENKEIHIKESKLAY